MSELDGLSVLLAMPANRDIPPPVVGALLQTADTLRLKSLPVEILLLREGPLCYARNKAAAHFLASDRNRLLFIDSDIVWTAADVVRLLKLSASMDIVSACYTTKQDPPHFFVKLDGSLRRPVNGYGCFPIDGTGLGFTVISRPVIERIAQSVPAVRYMKEPSCPQIFKFDYPNGDFRGEDIGFFTLAKECGFQPYLDPNITLTHLGGKAYRGSILDSVRLEPKVA